MDKKAMYNLTYGLYILTARDGEKDNGCIINTACQVTTEPNRITICVNKNNFTHDIILKTGLFNISMLTERSEFATYKHWGFQSGRTVDKVLPIYYMRADNGVIYIKDECNAYLSCKVVSSTDLGTHTLFLADVTDGAVFNNDPSATYAFYQKNIKESSASKAPEQKGWICTVCGYVYEGEELPSDFVCPWCNHDASYFEKRG
ncbi:MAG: flavin reductase [Ruminococcaceae bacterium]|nr:flavin reductase [Oscillospiraceae bacterium]